MMFGVARRLLIVALRNEKGSYNIEEQEEPFKIIVALRNEKGSYNKQAK